MRNYVAILTGNMVLNTAIIAWAMAQVLKVVIMLVQKREFDFRVFVGSGGMPSSHSATVCACAVSTGIVAGWGSVAFAVAAVLAFVVMYDAANVRQAAGKQAKILNYIMKHWNEMPPAIFGRELKELLGHTPIQVFSGALLGCAVGAFVPWVSG